jgi:tetratricopeptide (TPR) repeat protein
MLHMIDRLRAGNAGTLRAARVIFISLVLGMALCAGLHTVSDSDLGWHLATGRWVVEHRQIPRTDVLTFTSAGKPWAYPPFAGVILYLVYCLGGYSALSWCSAIACLFVVGYLVRRNDQPTAILAMFAVQSIAVRTAPRADMFSTIFFALFLGELWSYHRQLRARLWLLPLGMLFWVNLHPGFIAGLGVIAVFLFLEAAELPFAGRRMAALQRVRAAWPWLAATVIATLANPWGYKIFEVAGVLSGVTDRSAGKLNSASFIAEYQSVPLSLHMLSRLADFRHMEHGFTWLLALAACLTLVALWRRQLGAAMLLIAGLLCGLMYARFMALFAITTVTIGGSILAGIFGLRRAANDGPAEVSPRPLLRLHESAAVVLMVPLCFLAGLHIADYVTSRTYVVFNSDWRFGAGLSSWFPERAAAFIERENLPGNIFEEYALGGYEAFRLGPRYPDFLDGRSDRLSPGLVVEQSSLYTSDPDSLLWRSVADRWNINVVIVAVSGLRSLQRLSPVNFCASAGWRAIYMDDSAMVFMRNLPQNQPWLNRLSISCEAQTPPLPKQAGRTRLYDYHLSSGALFLGLRREAEAESALRKAEALFPEDPNARVLLAELYWHQGRPREAEREFLAATARGESILAWQSLGQFYVSAGGFAKAAAALRRAAAISPQPTTIDLQLAELELNRNQPSAALKMYDEAERSSPFRNGAEALAPGLYSQIAEGRSEAYRELGSLPEAIRFQLRSSQLTPDNARRWNRLADLYEANGQLSLALEARQRATQAAPH